MPRTAGPFALLTVLRMAELARQPVSRIERLIADAPDIRPTAVADGRPVYERQAFLRVLSLLEQSDASLGDFLPLSDAAAALNQPAAVVRKACRSIGVQPDRITDGTLLALALIAWCRENRIAGSGVAGCAREVASLSADQLRGMLEWFAVTIRDDAGQDHHIDLAALHRVVTQARRESGHA